MNKYIRVSDNTIKEISFFEESPDGYLFAPNIDMKFCGQPISNFDPDNGYAPTPEFQVTLDQEKLSEAQESFCKLVEGHLLNIFEQGFTYNGNQIQGDKTAQQNANAFMVLASIGEAEYPLYWRTRDNSFMPLNNLDEVKAFSKAMLGFVQGEYQRIWTAKDSIRAAATAEEAEAIYNNYIGV